MKKKKCLNQLLIWKIKNLFLHAKFTAVILLHYIIFTAFIVCTYSNRTKNNDNKN